MKWMLIAGGSLILLVGVIALIGAMLPSAHKAMRWARFRQKPEAIYAVLAGPPDWRSDVQKFEYLSDKDGRKQWWESTQGHRITYELVEDVAPSRRVTRIVDRSLPFGGTWTVEIVPDTQGAVVRITEDGEVYNVIFRFMARFVFGHTRTIEGYLRDLGRKFGDTVQIEA
jgi:hypothetical protein